MKDRHKRTLSGAREGRGYSAYRVRKGRRTKRRGEEGGERRDEGDVAKEGTGLRRCMKVRPAGPEYDRHTGKKACTKDGDFVTTWKGQGGAPPWLTIAIVVVHQLHDIAVATPSLKHLQRSCIPAVLFGAFVSGWLSNTLWPCCTTQPRALGSITIPRGLQ